MTTKHYFTGIFAVMSVLFGCAQPPGDRQAVTIKGSDTMVLLGQRWAEIYMKDHPNVDDSGDRRRQRYRHRSVD